MSEPKQIKFYGAVSLIEYHMDVDGMNRRVFVGEVEVYEANEFLGFRTGASEANWFVTVSSPEGRTPVRKYIFPGCKIANLIEVERGSVPQADSVKLV